MITFEGKIFLNILIITMLTFVLNFERIQRQVESHSQHGVDMSIMQVNEATHSHILYRRAKPDDDAGSSEKKPKKPDSLPKKCGKRPSENKPKIVGGHEAEPGTWPWMAVVKVGKKKSQTRLCGGSLVTDRHVITAQRCLSDLNTNRTNCHLVNPSMITITLGAHNISVSDEKNAKDFGVDVIRCPPDPNDDEVLRKDLAVLKLDKKVTFNSAISPICLPYGSLRDKDLTGKEAIIIGHGKTYNHGKTSDVLREATVEIEKQDVCERLYKPRVDSNHICTKRMKNSCKGDSGGPMMYDKDGLYYLIGIVSFSIRCGETGYPQVLERVTEYLDWLTKNLV